MINDEVKQQLEELRDKISKEKKEIKRAWESVHKTEGSNGLYALYGYEDVNGRSYAKNRERILEGYEREYKILKDKIREQKRIKELNKSTIDEIIDETIKLINDEKIINNLKVVKDKVLLEL